MGPHRAESAEEKDTIMLNTVVLAASAVAEEAHRDLPVQPYWFAIGFFATFVLLAVVVASFSGRGVVRTESGPYDLGTDEREAWTEYESKHGSRASH